VDFFTSIGDFFSRSDQPLAGDTSMGTAFQVGDAQAQAAGTAGMASFSRNLENSFISDIQRAGREYIANPVREFIGLDAIDTDALNRAETQRLETAASMASANAQKLQEDLNFQNLTTSDVNNIGSLTNFVTQKTAQALPYMGASLATMGTMTYPFTTGEVIQSINPIDGLTQEQKDNVAATGGLIMTALENLGIASLLPKGTSSSILGAIAKGFVTESSTESLQELVVIGSESIAGKEFSPSEILNRLKEAGAAGGVAGGVIRGAPLVPSRAVDLGRSAIDVAQRIEVDPNALGMSGGNVKLRPKKKVDFSDELVEKLGTENAQKIADNIASVGSLGNLVGEDAGAGQLVSSYADLPVIDPQTLVGSTVSSTQADLTRAGKVFDEFDGVKLDKGQPLLGGPFFPLQESYFVKGIGWVSQGPKQARELIAPEKGGTAADFVYVSAMGDASHQSNASLVQTMIATTMAFAREGRISEKNLSAISEKIREFGRNTEQQELKSLANFTSFDDSKINEFIQSLNFPARKAIAEQLAKKSYQDLGAPNIRRLLDQTLQPELAGQNPGDVMLVLKPRTGEGDFGSLIDLKEAGVMPHSSYQYGANLDVVGKYANPVSSQSAFPDFYKSRGTLTDVEALSRGSRGRNEQLDFRVQDAAANRDKRSFTFSNPRQLITPQAADMIEGSIGYAASLNPTTSRLISMGKRGDFADTGLPVNQGGVSPAKIQEAFNRNAGGVSLDKVDAKAIKKGDVKYFQLSGKTGEGRAVPTDVFFGIKKNPDYSWVDDFNGNPIKTGPNDLALTGVVANELATGGISIPVIMGKALEEGVTILDAFAVPSKRYPDGFLPEIYEDYGFEVVGKVPFDKNVFLAENTENQYNELLSYWRSTGWDESRGFPDVVVMKWRGNDNERAGAAKSILSANSNSFGGRTTGSAVTEAAKLSRQSVRQTVEEKRLLGQDIGSGDTGGVRQNNVTQLTNRSRDVIGALDNLDPMQRANLGIP